MKYLIKYLLLVTDGIDKSVIVLNKIFISLMKPLISIH